MRKLTRDNKDINKLDNVVANCACAVNCVGDSAAMLYYRSIQNRASSAGGPTPFRKESVNK